jgi:hypothetical protein
MAARDAHDATVEGPDEPDSTIVVSEQSSERTTFEERGNPDGWISVATAVTVDLER